MNLNSTIGLISTVSLLLPVVCILVMRLTVHRSFIALLIYYISVFVFNLFTTGILKVDLEVIKYWGFANNALDIPLMLYFVTYFKASKKFAVNIHRAIGAYLLFELAVVVLNGINRITTTIILGPGLLLLAILWVQFFVRQAKWAIENKKATGKAMISASMVFAYGCYLFIYLMFYVFQTHMENGKINAQLLNDTHLVLHLVSIFSSLLLSAGIFIERKRVQKLNELKITRKELSAIYTNTKAAVPFRTAVLDFDKELMN